MTSPCAALWTCRWLDLRGYERPFPADDFNLNEVRLGRKVKNSQARKPHQRGMGGRGTDDDDTHERQTGTNRLNIVNVQTTPLSRPARCAGRHPAMRPARQHTRPAPSDAPFLLLRRLGQELHPPPVRQQQRPPRGARGLPRIREILRLTHMDMTDDCGGFFRGPFHPCAQDEPWLAAERERRAASLRRERYDPAAVRPRWAYTTRGSGTTEMGAVPVLPRHSVSDAGGGREGQRGSGRGKRSRGVAARSVTAAGRGAGGASCRPSSTTRVSGSGSSRRLSGLPPRGTQPLGSRL